MRQLKFVSPRRELPRRAAPDNLARDALGQRDLGVEPPAVADREAHRDLAPRVRDGTGDASKLPQIGAHDDAPETWRG